LNRAGPLLLIGREIAQRLSLVASLSPFFPYLLAPAPSQKGSLQGTASEAVTQPVCCPGQAGHEWF